MKLLAKTATNTGQTAKSAMMIGTANAAMGKKMSQSGEGDQA